MPACTRLAYSLTSSSSFAISYFHPRVLADIESWPVTLLADYARLIELLAAHGPDLRLPHSRALGAGLFEMRVHSPHAIGRAFYCFRKGQQVIILHAFVKKSQATPDKDLAIARQRLKALRHA